MMDFSTCVKIWEIGLCLGVFSIPLLKGYHFARYESVWQFTGNENSQFTYLPPPTLYLIFCIVWPVVLALFMILGVPNLIGFGIGTLVRRRAVALETVKKERETLEASGRSEVEKLLEDRKYV